LNGRTFEYLSEDPFLTKEIAVPYIKGVQELRIAACVKHYAANNQETKRFSVNAEIAERPLHEIYLRAYRDIVKEADPWTFMACYNKVNGLHGCEHHELLTEILFEKFKFDGLVMSDWFATKSIKEPEKCIKAGLSLEMPTALTYTKKKLRASFEAKRFSEAEVDALLRRTLRVMVLTGVFDTNIPKGSRNTKEHQALAQKMAENGMVLLKNDQNILPLDSQKIMKIAVVGANAKKKMGKPLYGGSSAVVPPFEITPFEGLKRKLGNTVDFIQDPKEADYALVITGLNHYSHMDTENSDRKILELPAKEERLIKDTVAKNPNTIVVLISGSPVAMDNWIANVPAVLEAWYPGMHGGDALANIIFGDVSPSGKLPITFPKKLADSPAHLSHRTFPGDEKVFYDEGIYVGYRHFDTKNIEPLFPFGHGLSYTTFELSNAKSDKATYRADEMIDISLSVKNTGGRIGAEVVQVYSHDVKASVERPENELVGFEKVWLKPGEQKQIAIKVNVADLAFYDESIHDWKVEPGEFILRLGTSSRQIINELAIMVQ
jgi:beta-glucosidase